MLNFSILCMIWTEDNKIYLKYCTVCANLGFFDLKSWITNKKFISTMYTNTITINK